MSKIYPTQSELQSVISYIPHTGDLILIIRKKGGGCNVGDILGNITSNGRYIEVGFNGISYYAHQLIWIYLYGYCPKEIDHIDHNGLNNKLTNLRECSHADNGRNLSKRKTNTSGVTGVYWNKSNSKWIANISFEGKTIYLGSFINQDDAITARKAAEVKYCFHENHGI